MFSELPEKAFGKICAVARFVRADRKEILFTEGETTRGFYVILSGQVRIFKAGPYGRMQVLHILGAPSSFAEAALFMPGYPATAQATRKTQLAFIDRNSFLRLAGSDKQLVLSIIASMSRWLKHMTDMIESLTLKSVSTRLAGYVLALESDKRTALASGQGLLRGDSPGSFGLRPTGSPRSSAERAAGTRSSAKGARPLSSPLSKTALAGLLGTTKETLSRTLHKFSHSRILLFCGANITILNHKKLQDIAEGLEKM